MDSLPRLGCRFPILLLADTSLNALHLPPPPQSLVSMLKVSNIMIDWQICQYITNHIKTWRGLSTQNDILQFPFVTLSSVVSTWYLIAGLKEMFVAPLTLQSLHILRQLWPKVVERKLEFHVFTLNLINNLPPASPFPWLFYFNNRQVQLIIILKPYSIFSQILIGQLQMILLFLHPWMVHHVFGILHLVNVFVCLMIPGFALFCLVDFNL